MDNRYIGRRLNRLLAQPAEDEQLAEKSVERLPQLFVAHWLRKAGIAAIGYLAGWQSCVTDHGRKARTVRSARPV